MRAEYGLAYMRFARRAEGVEASRAVFGWANQHRLASWEVYKASGEYRLV